MTYIYIYIHWDRLYRRCNCVTDMHGGLGWSRLASRRRNSWNWWRGSPEHDCWRGCSYSRHQRHGFVSRAPGPHHQFWWRNNFVDAPLLNKGGAQLAPRLPRSNWTSSSNTISTCTVAQQLAALMHGTGELENAVNVLSPAFLQKDFRGKLMGLSPFSRLW